MSSVSPVPPGSRTPSVWFAARNRSACPPTFCSVRRVIAIPTETIQFTPSRRLPARGITYRHERGRASSLFRSMINLACSPMTLVSSRSRTRGWIIVVIGEWTTDVSLLTNFREHSGANNLDRPRHDRCTRLLSAKQFNCSRQLKNGAIF